MKKVKLFSIVLTLILTSTFTMFAGVKTDKFKVSGNCEMCKSRIEKAAMLISGVSKANWNKDTKILEVAYDETKTSADKIQMVIAKSGHDTEIQKAKVEDYNKLPGCCKYNRSDEKKMPSGCTRPQKDSKNSSCCGKK
ncbi:MAG: heavy-metal-associated domain-containing protein [Bacteroidales bacterium]